MKENALFAYPGSNTGRIQTLGGFKHWEGSNTGGFNPRGVSILGGSNHGGVKNLGGLDHLSFEREDGARLSSGAAPKTHHVSRQPAEDIFGLEIAIHRQYLSVDMPCLKTLFTEQMSQDSVCHSVFRHLSQNLFAS